MATPPERRAILEELVFTLEKAGASADRERSRPMGPAEVTDSKESLRRRVVQFQWVIRHKVSAS